MLRRLFGVGAGVAALTAVPISLHTPESGVVPTPAVTDLACTETKDCCHQLNSICMATGEPVPDGTEARGGTCQ